MALLDMQKVRLVGLKSQQSKLITALAESNVFEPREGEKIAGTEKSADFSRLDFLLGKIARFSFAINLIENSIDEYNQISMGQVNVIKASDASWSDLDTVLAEIDDLEKELEIVEQLSYDRNDIKLARNKNKAMIKMLSTYEACDDKFSTFKNTDKCGVLLVVGKHNETAISKMCELGYVYDYSEAGFIRTYAVVYLLENDEKIKSLLAENGLTICPYTFDNTVGGEIERLYLENSKLNKDEIEIIRKIADSSNSINKFKLMHDALSIEIEKTKANLDCYNTDQTYIIEGWVPRAEADKLESKISQGNVQALVERSEAKEIDNPPTLYKKNGILAPFQNLTDSYSPPKYGEFDPGLFTMFFFFLFFGMMTADAGYGLVLSIMTFLIVKVAKPNAGFKSLVMLIGISSISAIIWGVLFGSVFGLDFSVFGGIFGIEVPGSVWFNPLDVDAGGPMMLFVVSLVIGVLHMFCGYLIKFYSLAKQGKVFDAICDAGFMMVVYVGVAMLILWMSVEMLGVTLLPSELSVLLMPGLVTFASGIICIVLTKGRKKPSIGGKIISGASGFYDIVNILSDVLSYARIFGIALASCAIALAFNTLVELVSGGGIIGVGLGVVLAIVLHAFNLAMGVLSAYVHNARLQYLEFYGKFYEGGGRSFAPLGRKTKYIKLH